MSTVIIILLLLFIGIFIFLFLTPVFIDIDTDEQRYRVGMKGVVNGSIVPAEHFFIIRLKLLFFSKDIDPLRFKPKKFTDKEVRLEKGSRKKPDILAVMNIIRSFKIDQLEADIDTGDYPLNAQLIPLSVALNELWNVKVGINFDNENRLKLHIRNNLFNLFKSFIKIKYSSKN